jgi:hypothetical protein
VARETGIAESLWLTLSHKERQLGMRSWVERISRSRRAYVILAILMARSLRIDSSQGGVSVEGEE